MLQQNAPKSLTQEVLEQRALMPVTRFRPRVGKNQVTFAAQADAPSCAECGSIMVRNGSCYKCLNCGSTSGCS